MTDPTPHEAVNSAPRRLDPWIEQERRREEHRRSRRRTRWLRAAAVGCFALVLGGLIALVLRADTEIDDEGRDVTVSPRATSTTTSADSVPPTTAAIETFIAVEESWLLASPDGTYDWGVVVSTPPGAPTRSGVELDVRLLAADDEVVDALSFSFDGVGDDAPGVGSGRLENPDDAPVRIEFDVVPGRESDDLGLDDVLAVRALERSGDLLTGRIRVTGRESLDAVGALFVWRDDDGAVVAAVPLAIERVRRGVDARFELDLTDEAIPPGAPDSTFWTP